MLHGIFLVFIRKCLFKCATLCMQVQKAVHKLAEPWKLHSFAGINKSLLVLAVVYHVKLQPGHQQLQTILDEGYCVPVKKWYSTEREWPTMQLHALYHFTVKLHAVTNFYLCWDFSSRDNVDINLTDLIFSYKHCTSKMEWHNWCVAH